MPSRGREMDLGGSSDWFEPSIPASKGNGNAWQSGVVVFVSRIPTRVPTLGTIDRPMDRLSCNLLVESRVWRNGVVAQFRGWRTTARAQWKINLNLTRFHTARCIIGGWDDEGGTKPPPPQDLRRRKVEGFGKFGRNNIRGWNELWSVIRWLMVRLEFHEALVERDVRHCLRKITYLLFLLLRMDLCVFSSLWHLQGEGVSSRREF